MMQENSREPEARATEVLKVRLHREQSKKVTHICCDPHSEKVGTSGVRVQLSRHGLQKGTLTPLTSKFEKIADPLAKRSGRIASENRNVPF